MSRPSLASSVPASRVTRALPSRRLRVARIAPARVRGLGRESRDRPRLRARPLDRAKRDVRHRQRVPARSAPSPVGRVGRARSEGNARRGDRERIPAAAAAFVAARFLILSLGLLRLSTRRSKASVSAATAIACVVSHGVQASHAFRAADASAGAPRLVSSRQAVTRCETRFGANLCQRAVVHASAHTVARTPGGGPPSRRDSVHPRRR